LLRRSIGRLGGQKCFENVSWHWQNTTQASIIENCFVKIITPPSREGFQMFPNKLERITLGYPA
jgi:hypothetical protein